MYQHKVLWWVTETIRAERKCTVLNEKYLDNILKNTADPQTETKFRSKTNFGLGHAKEGQVCENTEYMPSVCVVQKIFGVCKWSTSLCVLWPRMFHLSIQIVSSTWMSGQTAKMYSYCTVAAQKSQAGNLQKFTFSTLWGLFSLNEELITMY